MTVSLDDRFVLRDGPQVRVRVELTRAAVLVRRRAGQAVPQPVELSALIDTGADCTCLDVSVVRRLGLPLQTATFVFAPGVRGLGFTPQREASLAVLHPTPHPNLELRFPSLPVAELDLRGVRCAALLGRDVLARCVLTYDGPRAAFTLAY